MGPPFPVLPSLTPGGGGRFQEVISSITQDEDLDQKKRCYESLGIEEYFLYDPNGDYLFPHLQGYRLIGSRYEPIRPRPDGSLDSRTIGLTLTVGGLHLRLIEGRATK